MKKIIIASVMILMVLAIGIETFTIIKQKQSIEVLNEKISEMKNDTDKKLAEKVIIHAYKEFKKAGNLLPDGSVDYLIALSTIHSNFELVKNSYNGSDNDITNMLNLAYDYLDYVHSLVLKFDSLSTNEKNEAWLKSFDKYSAADKALNSCISKYALFDKVGLE